MTLPRGTTLTDPIAESSAAASGGGGAAPSRAGRGRRRPFRVTALVSGLVISGIVLAACGSDTDTATAANGADQAVKVSGAWARTSPAMATAGAAYMDLTSADGDRLVAAAVDSGIAATIEIHETVAADDGAMDHGASDDSASDDSASDDGAMEQAMTMRELASGLELPAGETVNLAPGGYHIMMLDLAQPLETGSTFDLVLTFEQAGEQTISVEVRNEAP